MRLPLRDAARMSILSSEWRCKWLTIPDLVFDEDHLRKRKSPMDHVRIVDGTLWNHFGPIYKFSCNLSNINSKDLSRWIAKLHWNEIKQLILIPKWGLEVVPNTLFYCQGLCYLELYCCKLELHPLLKGFPSLTHLNLRDMYMPEDTLAGLISNCPLLERLTLKGHGSYLKVDAPNLRYLDVRGAFRDIWIESNIPKKLSTTYDHLRYLHIKVDFANLKDILATLCLWRSSPNLNELKIECLLPQEEIKYWDGEEQPDCLLDQLKVVKMVGIFGGLSDLGFVKFILANAPKLETLSFKINERVDSRRPSIFEELLRYRRASPNAQIIYMGTIPFVL
ncbi:F-box/FBD/LRR-repeat protein isoform X1 [Cinnamomum micranthum f. kanehirae]|uniref:F-box/FBD/LRR-repeat protein isoform X1 n=1 Tax=Cinnamomum micranthum f. kanehirae TaxID=337451 RepID=A0A3S3N2Y1_9MAGN|nr:F-box/FBD/LRR-repeat protein isoform X1 [Cinnamomum micranthum f. kanehirae]